MDKELVKKASIAILFLCATPLIVMYFGTLDEVALWLYAWILPFCYIVFRQKTDLFSKGLNLIAYTVIVCAIGRDYLVESNPELEPTVSSFILMITLISGGIGGNFMSHDLIEKHKK